MADAGRWAYDNAGTIGMVAGAAAMVTPLAPIAGPIALAATALQTGKDVAAGNWGAVAADVFSLGTGGFGLHAANLARMYGRALQSNNPWLTPHHLIKAAQHYTRMSRLSFLSSSLSLASGNTIWPVTDAFGNKIAPPMLYC